MEKEYIVSVSSEVVITVYAENEAGAEEQVWSSLWEDTKGFIACASIDSIEEVEN